MPCPANTYSSSRQTVEVAGQQCTPCPLNFQTDGPGQTSALACRCSRGVSNASACGLCGAGSYLDALANQCLACPAGSTSPPGSVGVLSCGCPQGTRQARSGNGIVCEACPPNTYSGSVGVACVPCPPQMVTAGSGSRSLIDCRCAEGLVLHAGRCLPS